MRGYLKLEVLRGQHCDLWEGLGTEWTPLYFSVGSPLYDSVILEMTFIISFLNLR